MLCYPISTFTNIMGNTPSQIRAMAKSTNGENEKVANDALNNMGTLAREKMKNFKLAVMSNNESHEVPVDKVLYQHQMLCCSVSENDEKLTGTVKDLVTNIANGKYVEALLTGANTVLNSLFGSMVGNEGEHSFYRIVVGPLGGIRRVDINLYMWAFSSETLLTLTKNILVVSVVVSSVDVQALDVSTLRVAIEQTCGDDIEMGKKLLNDILFEWKAEKKLISADNLPLRYLPSGEDFNTNGKRPNNDGPVYVVDKKKNKTNDTQSSDYTISR